MRKTLINMQMKIIRNKARIYPNAQLDLCERVRSCVKNALTIARTIVRMVRN